MNSTFATNFISYKQPISMITSTSKKLLGLLKEVGGEKSFDEPLCRHTSFRVGGKADIFFSPINEVSLITAVKIANKMDVPIFILGNGSNVLIRDGGIHGLVISLKKLKGEIESKKMGRNIFLLTFPAGILMPQLVRYTINMSLRGLESLIGVPGTLGGALKMNAGAHGSEIGDVVHSVKMVNMKGEARKFNKDEIRFYYRGAEFLEEGIFLNATLKLEKINKDDLLQKVKTLLEKRNSNQPSQSGAGSIFKNPKGHYAGQLIDRAGLKGFAIGDAVVSPKHANFILNRGNAKAKDIEGLIKHIQEKVMDKTGISLEPEIVFAGEPE